MALGFSTNIFLALIFFAIANFGCQEAIIFYNALMVKVAPRGKIGFVSGLGRMFGYSGAILALYLTKPIILKMGYQATFLFTGILFLIFSLPCMIFIKEDIKKDEPEKETGQSSSLDKEGLLQVFRKLKVTIFEDARFRELKGLLKASFFVLCAVNTIIIFMAVYASKVFGLNESQIINLIAFSTIFAIGGSIVSGFVSDFIGYRRSLLGVFFLWGICILTGSLLGPPFHWLIGALAGTSLGSTWVIMRALVIKLVPRERMGEAFGLFNLVSYFSGVVGPLFWGLTLLYFSRFGEWGYRASFLGLILFVALGVSFLLKEGREANMRNRGMR
jgi:UMF1 family MFS transporter